MPTVTHIIDSNLPIYATGNQTISGLKTFTNGISAQVNINNITANFTFSGDWNSRLLTINSSQNLTGTVPSGLTTGYNISFVQMGNGQLFVTGANGVTIRQRLNLYNTAGQYAIASLLHHSGNQYILYGDLI